MIGQNRCSAPKEALQALGAHLAEGSGLGTRSGLAPERKPTGVDEASTVKAVGNGSHPELDSHQDSRVLPAEQLFRLGGHY